MPRPVRSPHLLNLLLYGTLLVPVELVLALVGLTDGHKLARIELQQEHLQQASIRSDVNILAFLS